MIGTGSTDPLKLITREAPSAHPSRFWNCTPFSRMLLADFAHTISVRYRVS